MINEALWPRVQLDREDKFSKRACSLVGREKTIIMHHFSTKGNDKRVALCSCKVREISTPFDYPTLIRSLATWGKNSQKILKWLGKFHDYLDFWRPSLIFDGEFWRALLFCLLKLLSWAVEQVSCWIGRVNKTQTENFYREINFISWLFTSICPFSSQLSQKLNVP